MDTNTNEEMTQRLKLHSTMIAESLIKTLTEMTPLITETYDLKGHEDALMNTALATAMLKLSREGNNGVMSLMADGESWVASGLCDLTNDKPPAEATRLIIDQLLTKILRTEKEPKAKEPELSTNEQTRADILSEISTDTVH